MHVCMMDLLLFSDLTRDFIGGALARPINQSSGIRKPKTLYSRPRKASSSESELNGDLPKSD